MKILIDEVEENPIYGFNEYAKIIENILLNNTSNYCIGIHGSWGYGKTTLMRLVEKQIKAKEELSNDIISVWFNPWRHEKETTYALEPLLKTITNSIPEKKYKNLKEAFKEASLFTLKSTSTIIPSILGNYLGENVKKIAEQSTSSFLEDIVPALKKYNEIDKNTIYYEGVKNIENRMKEIMNNNLNVKIVVFIDDLDRCSDSTVIQVFESIKVFLNIIGFIYILGISNDTISRLFMSYSNENKIKVGEEYIKKIIQIPFHIYNWTPESIETLIEHSVKKLEEENKKIILENKKIIADIIPSNPREIKRFLNTFIITYNIHKITDKPINKIELLLAHLLKYRWPEFYEAFANFREVRDLIRELIKLPTYRINDILLFLKLDNNNLKEETFNENERWLIQSIDNLGNISNSFYNNDDKLWRFLSTQLQIFKIPDWSIYSPIQEREEEGENTSLEQLYGSAYSYQTLGRFNESLNLINRILKKDSNHYDAINLKGMIFNKVQRYEEAVECFDKTIKIKPEYFYAYYNKGLTLQAMNKNEEAITNFKKAVELDPSHDQSIFSIALSYERMGKYEDALEYYDKAIILNQKDYKSVLGKAVILFLQRDYQNAIEFCNQTIVLNPNEGSAQYYKGKSLSELKKYEEAVECFDKAIELNLILALYEKGRAYELMGDNINLGNAQRKSYYTSAINCVQRFINLSSVESNVVINDLAIITEKISKIS